MKAWYFSRADKKLRYDDNRIIELGTTHKVAGKPELCSHGLHASKRLIDALEYAPGSILWRVELGGEIVEGNDKVVATERTYIGGGVDVSTELRRFARMCALDHIDKWDAPDLVIEYLKTGEDSLRSAAWSASSSAEWSASASAARSARASAASPAASPAAWSAAWSAVRSASASAARSAARSAAWSASSSAEWSASASAARSARASAAWSAVRSAARSAQQRRLTSMLSKFIKN